MIPLPLSFTWNNGVILRQREAVWGGVGTWNHGVPTPSFQFHILVTPGLERKGTLVRVLKGPLLLAEPRSRGPIPVSGS